MTASLTRRSFLHATATAAAATTLATAAASRAADAPAKTIVLGVMGTNGRGSALTAGFAALPGVRIGYVCDVDQRAIGKAVKEATARGAAAPQAVKDFRKILDDPAVDALVVAAPDHWHAPATILACAAGKHVYVEKPASHNGREGQLMIAAAKKHNRAVQMGSQRRSSPGIAEALGLLREGRIGRVLFARGWITSTRGSIGRGATAPVPAWLDFDLWQGPAPRRPYRDNVVHYNWHWFWHWGTGELGNNGIHALDMCRWGLGVEYPRRVVCGGGRYHFDDDQETPDTQLATFDFGDKAIHWEHRTWNARGFEGEEFGATFYGEKGALVLGDSKSVFYDMAGKPIQEVKCSGGQSEHLANFLDAVRTGKRPNAWIEEGVASTTLCHLGNIAYRTGRTVNFDPEKREIVGDAEADPPVRTRLGTEGVATVPK